MDQPADTCQEGYAVIIVQHFSGVFERAAHLLFPVSGITVVQKKNGRQEVGVQREDMAGYIFREQLLEHLERLAVNIQRDITDRAGEIIPGIRIPDELDCGRGIRAGVQGDFKFLLLEPELFAAFEKVIQEFDIKTLLE